jgi:hypothetical protein
MWFVFLIPSSSLIWKFIQVVCSVSVPYNTPLLPRSRLFLPKETISSFKFYNYCCCEHFKTCFLLHICKNCSKEYPKNKTGMLKRTRECQEGFLVVGFIFVLPSSMSSPWSTYLSALAGILYQTF